MAGWFNMQSVMNVTSINKTWVFPDETFRWGCRWRVWGDIQSEWLLTQNNCFAEKKKKSPSHTKETSVKRKK